MAGTNGKPDRPLRETNTLVTSSVKIWRIASAAKPAIFVVQPGMAKSVVNLNTTATAEIRTGNAPTTSEPTSRRTNMRSLNTEIALRP